MSCNQIAEYTGHTTKTISTLLRNNNYEVKINDGNKVNQYDLEGKFIQSFLSASEAARILGKTGKGSHITEVCNGKRKTAYGYK